YHRSLWPTALGLALAAGLAAAPARAAEADKYLPSDTEAVVGINVRQLLDAPLVKKYALEQIKDALKKNAEVTTALQAMNLDPFKDVNSVVIAVSDKVAQGQGLAIVHGNFDVSKITSTLEAA